jgi:hypothetical protein
MGYGSSIWDTGFYRYDHSPYRYGHPGYPYGNWDNDMGDDSIDMVILHIDMGYLVTLQPADQCEHEPKLPMPFAPHSCPQR